uniref:Expressed protein n=1 Tax=Oryza sativa subsp. japonica TaxID=39947 RepID=Q53NB2_ORYSJ|nr:expressed protein [Oryza sativa Japonica Group]
MARSLCFTIALDCRIRACRLILMELEVEVMMLMVIKALSTRFQLSKKVQNQEVPKAQDVLALISQSVRQVILDVKVGPPSFEKDLAEDVLSTIGRTQCKNCLVWAKSDNVGRDVIKLSKDITVGYIVMVDKSTGRTTELVRITGSKVAGVYHRLIHEKLMKVMHR